jgi:hypothetical protein
MPIRHAIWKVSEKPQQLKESLLASEQLLEKMILASPRLLSDQWMFIGQQEDTGYGGRIDLLAIAPDASLVLIELKRNKTPREVVAQALDYATWVEKLRSEDIAAIYGRFAQGHNLADDFKARFGQPLDEEMMNQNHQIIIVAAEIDESSERIISYLNERDIPINVLCFQVFENGTDQFISRAWLLDPAHTQVNATIQPDGQKEPWNGEFYASFGQGESRSWNEAVKYGFFCAGGGGWYSNTLNLLSVGDRIWVKAPGYGFVGVGRITGRPEPASSFHVTTPEGDKPVLDVVTDGQYHREFVDDKERCEYFVPVEWLQTVSIEKAVNEIGLFGNQNTVCKPTTPKWRSTIDRLKVIFPKSQAS